MNHRRVWGGLVVCCSLLSVGCDELPELDPDALSAADGGDMDGGSDETQPRPTRSAGRDSAAPASDGGISKPMTALEPRMDADSAVPVPPATPAADVSAPGSAAAVCGNGGSCAQIDITPFDRVDLLFVVDNSASMRQEQASLKAAFPRLIDRLTGPGSGTAARLPVVKDMHLGVVSTDMGLAGVPNNYPGCSGQRQLDGGDDGVLQHPGGTGPECAASYPAFLSYQRGSGDPSLLARDFGCIANLGTMGCGFEQQLEAGLKALWPKNFIDERGSVYPPGSNPILFLATDEAGRYGHSDVSSSEGGNGGFLRNDPATGMSQIAVVILTDEEDCSSQNTAHFAPTNDPASPLSAQSPNMRCFKNPQNLFDVQRYVLGFPRLRPADPDTVMFGAIVGVAPELVSADARAGVDFANEASRDAYYDRILAHESMQYRPVMEDMPALANLAPSCSRMDAAGQPAEAYPPRRIVEVAKGIGENAFVQSICQDDFGPAMDLLADLLAKKVGQRCLPRPIARNPAGKIDCELIWQLPPASGASAGAPVACEERAYLRPVGAQHPKLNALGGVNCSVDQLTVSAASVVAPGQGFYYDDFSDQRATCQGGAQQRIAFTDMAGPPETVGVYVDCRP